LWFVSSCRAIRIQLNFHSKLLRAIYHAEKSIQDTSTGVQNEIFIRMTILKPSVH